MSVPAKSLQDLLTEARKKVSALKEEPPFAEWKAKRYTVVLRGARKAFGDDMNSCPFCGPATWKLVEFFVQLMFCVLFCALR